MQAPQAAQERALNEVGRIDEKHLAVSGACLRQQRLQRVVQELGLLGDGFLGRQRDPCGATPLQAP